MKFFTLPGRVCRTADIRAIAEQAEGKYTLISLKPDIEWVLFSEERMTALMDDSGAVMGYADHFNKMVHEDGTWSATQAPVIDYQLGALRDDFDFGS